MTRRRRRRYSYSPTAMNPAAEPEPPAGHELCDLCGGTQWASFADPFLGGAFIDARCPACQDTTVRARKGCFEDNDGKRVGPT